MPRTSTPPRITVTGNTVTVTDGERAASSMCATPAAAKGLATRLKNDPGFLARWLNASKPEQLDLPFEVSPGVRPK